MRSMKGLLTIALHKRNCSVGRECSFVLLLLKYQCWKSTLVRMNDWRSVMAGTCSSASTGMQPVLSLKSANGSRNNDKSQLMLPRHIENQNCSVCWQQSTAIDDWFGKKNVTYLTRPPVDSRYYEILTTVIGKLRYNTVTRQQKGQWSSCPTQKICIRSFWGCQRRDWTVKTGHITPLKRQFWSPNSAQRIISLMASVLQTVGMQMTGCNHYKQHTIKRKPWVKVGG